MLKVKENATKLGVKTISVFNNVFVTSIAMKMYSPKSSILPNKVVMSSQARNTAHAPICIPNSVLCGAIKTKTSDRSKIKS